MLPGGPLRGKSSAAELFNDDFLRQDFAETPLPSFRNVRHNAFVVESSAATPRNRVGLLRPLNFEGRTRGVIYARPNALLHSGIT